MKQSASRFFVVTAVAAAIWMRNGQLDPAAPGFLMASAEARFGRPVTPVSYAGVARRAAR